MAEKSRIPLAEAEVIVRRFATALKPVCDRVEVAGSIRRRSPDVGDVELVCTPRMQQGGLFGDGYPIDQLDQAIALMLVEVTVQHRLDKNGRKSYGPKFKRLLYNGFALDLFSVLDPGQFGVIYAIRTGPADFSHRLVTAKRYGGMMPDGFSVKDGWLWKDGSQVPCHDEDELFRAIGLEFIKPEDRR